MQQTAITHKMQSIGWAAKWNIKEEGACVNSADRDYSERESDCLGARKIYCTCYDAHHFNF